MPNPNRRTPYINPPTAKPPDFLRIYPLCNYPNVNQTRMWSPASASFASSRLCAPVSSCVSKDSRKVAKPPRRIGEGAHKPFGARLTVTLNLEPENLDLKLGIWDLGPETRDLRLGTSQKPHGRHFRSGASRAAFPSTLTLTPEQT